MSSSITLRSLPQEPIFLIVSPTQPLPQALGGAILKGMNKNIFQPLKIIILALAFSVGISYVSAWTAPTVTPPNGNVSAPINVSGNDQTKLGSISAASFWDSNDPANFFVNPNGDSKVNNIFATGDVCSGWGSGSQKCLSALGGGVPSGMIAYFYTATCPSGWIPANGTSGTPDMRGVFPRGLDSSRGLDSGRTLGTYQADMVVSHTHSNVGMSMPGGGGTYRPQSYLTDSSGPSGTSGSTGGSETRPKNVALLVCMSV